MQNCLFFNPYLTHLSGTAVCVYSKNEAVRKHFALKPVKEEESRESEENAIIPILSHRKFLKRYLFYNVSAQICGIYRS